MYIALQRTRRQTATGKAHVLNVPYSFFSVTLLILRLVVKCIVKYKHIAVCSVHCHTATGTHMPYGITLFYGRGDIPSFNPAKLSWYSI